MYSNQLDDQNPLFGNYIYQHVIPVDHLLKKIDKIIDFGFVETETKQLYSSIGRPGISPVLMFKMIMVGFLYNISDRRLEEEVNLNIAYKWFVGLDVDQKAPDHSSLTRFRERLGEEGFRSLFNRIVQIAGNKGLINERLTIIDATHVEANVDIARLKKHKHNDDDHTYVDRNSPDPDARFGRKSKTKGFYGYKDHIAIDADSAIITSVETTPGNVPDRDVFEQLIRGQPDSLTADKGYDTNENLLILKARSIQPAIIPVNRGPGRPPLVERERPKVERMFAELKRNHGKARCRWLGLAKGNIQSLLSCAAVNLKTIARLIMKVPVVNYA